MWSRALNFLKTNRGLHIFGAVFLTIVGGSAIIFSLSGSPKKEVEPSPTAEEALKALRRVSPHALQICYDSGLGGGGYLFQFEEEGVQKWWFVALRPMWRSENGTWLTKTIGDSEWVQVGADVTGLKCDIKQ